jgi:hypothetical protein
MRDEMKFYRGICVSLNEKDRVIENIKRVGIDGDEVRWRMEHEHPGDLARLHIMPNLSRNETRPGINAVPAVCTCGELQGAVYYAFRHNASTAHNAPVLIELEAEITNVAIDGKDFLYTAFQRGDPARARVVLERAFGAEILKYAEKAWSTVNQDFRVAQCDLAIHDPEVIAAHHANTLVLGGRNKTVFRNAFTIALPVQAEAIMKVWSPPASPHIPPPDISLTDILSDIL